MFSIGYADLPVQFWCTSLGQVYQLFRQGGNDNELGSLVRADARPRKNHPRLAPPSNCWAVAKGGERRFVIGFSKFKISKSGSPELAGCIREQLMEKERGMQEKITKNKTTDEYGRIWTDMDGYGLAHEGAHGGPALMGRGYCEFWLANGGELGHFARR